jgi:cobalt/nickel transport system permease protein
MAIDAWAYTSRWRSIHPAEKALFSAGCVTAALLSRTPLVPVVVALLCGGLAVCAAGIPARQLLRTASVPAAFLAWSCIALMVSVSAPGSMPPAGSVVLPLGLAITPQGVATSVQAFVRSAAALSALLLFAFTTPMTDTITLLRCLRMPGLLLEMMSLIYRQLFIFTDTVSRVRRAQLSRLGYVDVPAARRSAGLLGGHLLATTLERSRSASRGLAARGYEGELRYLEPEYSTVARNLVMGGGAGVLLIAAALFVGA